MKLLLAVLIAGLVSPQALAADEPCELRVWPAQASNAVHSGVLSNFGLLGAYAEASSKGDANLHSQAALIEALNLPQQAQAMVAADLPQLLGVPNVKLVFDTQPMDLRGLAKARTRLSSSAAACYVELIVSMNEFRASSVRGSSLRTVLTFRDFRTGKLKTVAGDEVSPLKHFPAATAEQELAARTDLHAAFTENLRSFSRRVAKRR